MRIRANENDSYSLDSMNKGLILSFVKLIDVVHTWLSLVATYTSYDVHRLAHNVRINDIPSIFTLGMAFHGVMQIFAHSVNIAKVYAFLTQKIFIAFRDHSTERSNAFAAASDGVGRGVEKRKRRRA